MEKGQAWETASMLWENPFIYQRKAVCVCGHVNVCSYVYVCICAYAHMSNHVEAEVTVHYLP